MIITSSLDTVLCLGSSEAASWKVQFRPMAILPWANALSTSASSELVEAGSARPSSMSIFMNFSACRPPPDLEGGLARTVEELAPEGAEQLGVVADDRLGLGPAAEQRILDDSLGLDLLRARRPRRPRSAAATATRRPP